MKSFECKLCNYITTKKSNLDKHFTTKKHLSLVKSEDSVINLNTSITIKRYICNYCNKEYKHESGLSRHKKQCKNNKELNDKIQNLQNLLEKTIEDNNNTINKILPKVGNNIINNINNNLTINVFLNEQCKNAMNIKDFTDQLKLSIDDLQYTKENGFIKGITNIFVKNLSEMPINFRPIHCSDVNSLQFYIKDEDSWNKDNENFKINKSIQDITQKQIKQIMDWQQEHPNWHDNDKEKQLYMEMVCAVMGCDEDDDTIKNLEVIKKEIGANTYLNT